MKEHKERIAEVTGSFKDDLAKRVLLLDGAMGTMIQSRNLTEEDFRGDLPVKSGVKVKGANDLLSLTRPDIIRDIHRSYVEAGADIIETNSFNANAVSMAEYGVEGLIEDINVAAARIAREVAESAGRRVYVAGSMGPSNVSLSISEIGADVDFEQMAHAYKVQAKSLIKGGVDILLLETIFDTLNAKAALAGINDAFGELGYRVPLMISVTLTGAGRTLSGQSLPAAVISFEQSGLMNDGLGIIGLNCGFGAESMAPFLEQLRQTPYFISMHPNAGLPDEMGNYTHTPELMASFIEPFIRDRKLNIVGGCCGTTPEHIRAIREVRDKYASTAPRKPLNPTGDTLNLSGLNPLGLGSQSEFLKIGERCNVAGSRKFLRLINEGNLSEALGIAVGQVRKGAGVLDINMDDGLLDAPAEMEKFVMMLGGELEVASVPLMIDSSDMEVIRRALRRIQGKSIVNSISLKEGEEKFLKHAAEIKRLGAAVVVMAFDEEGQATDFRRKIEICARAYKLLTANGWKGSDIIFDPNILTIATGIPEHDRYALDYLEAVEWIKGNLPGAKVSGGVSNLSFAFRGNNRLREYMHTVFLHHAYIRGLDMAIVNPSVSMDIETVPAEIRERIEDVIFCRRPDATDRLVESGMNLAAPGSASGSASASASCSSSASPSAPGSASGSATWRDCNERNSDSSLESLIMRGMNHNLHAAIDSALAGEGSAMGVVKNRLMAAMKQVGDDFGAGKLFLPQVVRSASIMQKAIDYLTPYIEKESENKEDGNPSETVGERKFVLATVKGDVHDIGKNIVAIILRCSGFEVIDLGVMVEPDRIIATLRVSGAKYLGLSGLITPSLSEMCEVARRLEAEGMTDVTLCVGGATTSERHTELKIAPLFSGRTIHTRDAAQLPPRLSESENARTGEPSNRDSRHNGTHSVPDNVGTRLKEPSQAEENCGADAQRARVRWRARLAERRANARSVSDIPIPIEAITPGINWKAFLHAWQITPTMASGNAEEESSRLIADANTILDSLAAEKAHLQARYALLHARREGDDIIITYHAEDGRVQELFLPTLRRETPPFLALSDFISEKDDKIGLFCITTTGLQQSRTYKECQEDDYKKLLFQSLADRLVEAATDYLHTYVHEKVWQLRTPRGIRPAVGYPSLPDQSLVFELDKILDYSGMGVSLTENGALSPSATTTGLILGSPDARYFEVGKISEGALRDYAERRRLPLSRLRHLLPNI